ncbi:MAG TPA: hypothetical protein VK071_07475 [Tissierellales bacterium]|nr:hypothetical protein [Tissierellales bacterium]
MFSMYRPYLKEYLNLEDITDIELSRALEELGRDLVFSCLYLEKM